MFNIFGHWENIIHTPLKPYLIPVTKISSDNKCWRGCGESRPLLTVCENINWCSSHFRNHNGAGWGSSSSSPAISQLGIELPARNRAATGSSPGHMPSGLWIILQRFCSVVFIAALSTTAREVTQSICLSIDEWIVKM